MQIVGTSDKRLNKFLDALSREGDRGAALTAAALGEELLEDILKSYLADLPETTELISGFSAPIGTFAAKSKVAYSLGLMDSELYQAVNTMRKIRNEFAHQWEQVSFDMPPIRDLVIALPVHPILTGFRPPQTMRGRFDTCISAVLLELCFVPEVIKNEKRVPRRLVRFGKPHGSKPEAEAEWNAYKETGIPPWKI